MKKNFRPLHSFILLLSVVLNLQAQSAFDSLRTIRRIEVYFESGDARLDQKAEAALDSLIEFIRITPKQPNLQYRLIVSAHTDSVGSSVFNERLSQKRAESVAQALINRGADRTGADRTGADRAGADRAGADRAGADRAGADRAGADRAALLLFWNGERRPARSNASETDRRYNRRAVVEWCKIVPMTTYSGRAMDQTNANGVAATVYFSTKGASDSIQTDSSGRYAVRLPTDSIVRVETIAKGYFFHSYVQKIYGTPEMFARKKSPSPIVNLAPARTGEKAAISNLFFVGNQAVLLKTSEPELPKVLRFMQINPNLRIEIGGHVNIPNVPTDKILDSEKRLSELRAQRVGNYLVENGISSDRIVCKGYGNSQMLFPKGGTEAQQEQNRRVEVKIIE